jgi:hypothetical protein
MQSKSMFRSHIIEARNKVASSSANTRTFLGLCYPRIPIELLLQIPTAEEIMEDQKRMEKEKAVAREKASEEKHRLMREEQINAFRKFSEEFKMPEFTYEGNFKPLVRREPYLKDPFDNVNFAVIGELMLQQNKGIC